MNEITEGQISSDARYVAVSGSIVLLFIILYLIRKGLLKSGYSILWFIITISILLISLFNEILYWFSNLIGVFYAPSAVFSILIVGIILIVIHFSLVLTKQEHQIKTLAQENALMKEKIKKLDKKK